MNTLDILMQIGDTVHQVIVLAIVLPLIGTGIAALVSLVKEMKNDA